MTAKSISALNTQADTDLADNTAGDISALDVRTVVKDLADSAFNKVDDEAGSSGWRAATADKVLVADTTWASAAEVTLTDAATIAVDMSTFINATVTLGDNRTLGNPTNEKVGQTGYIRVVQDGTGSRTLSFGTDYEFAGGTAPTLTTTANAEDLLFYVVIATNRVFILSALDIS